MNTMISNSTSCMCSVYSSAISPVTTNLVRHNMTNISLSNSPTRQLLIFPPAICFFFLSICTTRLSVVEMQSTT